MNSANTKLSSGEIYRNTSVHSRGFGKDQGQRQNAAVGKGSHRRACHGDPRSTPPVPAAPPGNGVWEACESVTVPPFLESKKENS